jgi:hypothetical protein
LDIKGGKRQKFRRVIIMENIILLSGQMTSDAVRTAEPISGGGWLMLLSLFLIVFLVLALIFLKKRKMLISGLIISAIGLMWTAFLSSIYKIVSNKNDMEPILALSRSILVIGLILLIICFVKYFKEGSLSKLIKVKTSAIGADELLKYKKLLDDGVITQEDFDAKKKELLGL